MEIEQTRSSARVLIVDDEPDIRREIVWRLDREGFVNLREAASGNEALALHAEMPADLVITDIRMANGTGIDLIQALRQNPSLSLPVILVITAHTDMTASDAFLHKADAFFQKPFSLDDLISAGVHFLTLRQALAHSPDARRASACLDEIAELITVCTLRLQNLMHSLPGPHFELKSTVHAVQQLLGLHRKMQRTLADYRIRHQATDPEGLTEFSLTDLVQNIITLWKSQFDDQGATFDFHDEGLAGRLTPRVRGHANLLSNCVHALIEQALAAGGATPAVRISLTWEGPLASLSCESHAPEGTLPSIERGKHQDITDSLIQKIATLHGGSYEKQTGGDSQHLVLTLPTVI